MRENTIQSIWADGGAVLNGWLAIPSSWSAEVLANQGWDSLTVDMQHGLADLSQALSMMQAISTTSTIPLVRVPWNEPGVIMRSLDMGAYGVICPMINSRAECEAFVGACRYHPDGYRSLGPTRARVYAGADYMQHANSTVLTFAMIETSEAVKNIDEIVSVPGLDAIYIGPNDLRLSLMGEGGADNEDPEFMEAIDKVFAACKQRGVRIGFHTASVAYAQKMIDRGAQFVTVMSDSALLAAASSQVVTAFKEGGSAATKGGTLY
ncbi:MAG: 2,4-dihydroxyhept-2-ene-1,7-dioic acid aldolase [Anaerolineaceae bacterium]|nr:2,4-dihydroxyhept-2-ene-1,7-dioic acid aldolase [Anaerolineaceae bacterium]